MARDYGFARLFDHCNSVCRNGDRLWRAGNTPSTLNKGADAQRVDGRPDPVDYDRAGAHNAGASGNQASAGHDKAGHDNAATEDGRGHHTAAGEDDTATAAGEDDTTAATAA